MPQTTLFKMVVSGWFASAPIGGDKTIKDSFKTRLARRKFACLVRLIGKAELTDRSGPKIGVLAIQGDYDAHAAAVEESGGQPSLVKTPAALHGLDGLILPGGESTTMLRFLDRGDFFAVLRAFVLRKPVFGTCAGAILLAKDVRNPTHPEEKQRSLKALDIAVERNAYGAQRDSAIMVLDTTLPGGEMETVFIRAPRIISVGPGVEVLAERDGFPVLVRQAAPAPGETASSPSATPPPASATATILAATFHPELSSDRRVHRLFVEIVEESLGNTQAD